MLLNAFIGCDMLGPFPEDDMSTINESETGDEDSTNNPIGECPVSFKHLCKALNINGSIPAIQPKTPTPIYNGFRLPIEYLDPSDVYIVSDVVVSDLDLTSRDSSGCIFRGVCPSNIYSAGCSNTNYDTQTGGNASIYEYLTKPTNVFAGEMTREIQKRYTTNVSFLEETQQVLSETGEYTKTMSTYMNDELPDFVPNAESFLQIWRDIKEDADFLDKYSYLEWPMLEHLNHSEEFLQVFSMINIISPLFSLFIPILFFIFPFILLRLKQVEITIEQYIDTLREIAKHHFIGKALTSEFTVQGIVYLIFTAGLYFLQMYQNINSCFRFYANLMKMNTHLEHIRDHIHHSIQRMDIFVTSHKSKPTYRLFCIETEKHIRQLRVLLDKLGGITPFAMSMSKAGSVGYMLQCYYQLYANHKYEKSIRYSIGFGAYMDVLIGIHSKLVDGHLGKSTFVTTDQMVFRDQYFPTHSPDDCVKNTYDVSKNMIITGVNASGKTTYLKTTAINILLTQQFGVGFYTEGIIHPFTHIHSYLNIPDTSGRDSLFQAESRRCKEILDAIESTNTNDTGGETCSSSENVPKTNRHFIIFDELFSGTNPEEATKSAVSLLRYLAKFDNVRFILTTHYLKICKKFSKVRSISDAKRKEYEETPENEVRRSLRKASGNKIDEAKSDIKISNYKMNVKVNGDGQIQYLYTIKKGVSKIQGGVEILKMMNYPEEILQDIRKS